MNSIVSVEYIFSNGQRTMRKHAETRQYSNDALHEHPEHRIVFERQAAGGMARGANSSFHGWFLVQQINLKTD